jgi:hypothetical protein
MRLHYKNPDGQQVVGHIPDPAPQPSQGELVVSAWTILADGEHYAVCTFGTDEPVWFTVNGEPLEVPSEQGRATLEIAADAPGAIRVEIHDKQATIMAVTP